MTKVKVYQKKFKRQDHKVSIVVPCERRHKEYTCARKEPCPEFKVMAKVKGQTLRSQDLKIMVYPCERSQGIHMQYESPIYSAFNAI